MMRSFCDYTPTLQLLNSELLCARVSSGVRLSKGLWCQEGHGHASCASELLPLQYTTLFQDLFHQVFSRQSSRRYLTILLMLCDFIVLFLRMLSLFAQWTLTGIASFS